MRRILVAALVVVGVLIGVVVWRATREAGLRVLAPKPGVYPSVANDVAVKLRRVRIYGVSGGKVVWEIEAEDFNMAKNRPLLSITGIKRVAVVNGGKEELTLHANLLERNTATGDMTLTGDVTVESTGLRITTPLVTWDAAGEVLRIPSHFSAQVGDFSFRAPTGAIYDVKASTLQCAGGIVLTVQGNTLRAGTALVDINRQRYELADTVTAALNVASLESWAGGQRLPAIPTIPSGVQQRYREYLAKQETRRTPNANSWGAAPTKGVRP